MPASLELRDIHKEYGGRHIIRGVSLTVAPSEFLVLVGPSGCGKSTLLRMIAGLEGISSGDLFFDSERVNDWDPARRRVGMVFQSYALYPHMTVAENVGFSLRLAKMPRAERARQVDEALRVLQLEQLRDNKPSQLSGGQRQRVAIGRAIVRNPNVFLFDEPLSNLDAALRIQMRMEISRLHQRLRNTVVYVTHDQVEAMTLADRIVVLEGGVIRQVGAPLELYERPANRFVAGFIGTPTMAFLKIRRGDVKGGRIPVTVLGHPDGTMPILFDLRDSMACERATTLGIRPEHCQLSSIGDAMLAGTVVIVERLGADTFAFLDVAGAEDTVAVRLNGDARRVAVGDRVGLRFDPDRAHLFDADGVAVR
ncbi:sn-glycerol-3-phosphate ABC transporter ATP-binding protein UgpC [Sphingomonas sp. AP4-R1]|uniref:ABC transporter ATP-binding protein n=1 Tax=Sphingomonas sp. AP4-R1 TaxID=2735134 RepID=UPI001493951D|nr:sn-glycerol-3-phosphate ABC transporter ATP-binding protein UgpC [Sphingomonas sp. AP4-R1]QJU60267.1 sn-glycerol-3-phosphate ABC transporter ATP-binding protein UgpC [Sphingomonas sp. AP4-R1]